MTQVSKGVKSLFVSKNDEKTPIVGFLKGDVQALIG